MWEKWSHSFLTPLCWDLVVVSPEMLTWERSEFFRSLLYCNHEFSLLPHQQQVDTSPGWDDSAPWQPQEAAPPTSVFSMDLVFQSHTGSRYQNEPHLRFSIFYVSLFLETWMWSLSQLVLIVSWEIFLRYHLHISLFFINISDV